MADHHRKKRFVKRMYEANPYCPQCGVKMILPEDLPKDKSNPPRIKYFPPNTCTYEHKFIRLHPDRKNQEANKNFILCKQCNELNGSKQCLEILGEEGIKERAQLHSHEQRLKYLESRYLK